MADTVERSKRRGFLSRFLSRNKPVEVAPPKKNHAARRFKAARAGRLVGGFGSLLSSSSRAEVRQDFRGLVSHARFAAQNVDYLKSYEMMVRRHVVGWKGITLEMSAKDVNGKLDRVGNQKVEDAWTLWGKRGNCTPCGQLSWWQVEKIMATMLAREGNGLLRIWKGQKYGPFRFQVEPISIDLLDTDLVMALADGHYIDGGIEFDRHNQPIAYHIFDGHPAEPHRGSGQTRLRIPASEIIHVQRFSEAGQILGVPESHTSLRRFNLLGGYEESAAQAAHYGAAQMVFLKPPEEGAPAPAEDASDSMEEIPEEVEPGTIAELPPGYDIAANPSNYPDANMPGFMKSLLRGGAAGLGVSYAGLTSDMEGANFSSLKDGRGEERDEWRVFQRDLFEGLHDPVFLAWLPMAFLTGKIALPIAKIDKFASATWRGRGWPSVNPKDDATANEKNLQNFLTSPSDIVAERGENIEAVANRLARDVDTMNAARPGLGDMFLAAMTKSKSTTPEPVEPEVPGDQSS